MAKRISVVVIDPATGAPDAGRVLTLYYGTGAWTGTPTQEVGGPGGGDFTNDGDGAYHYDIDYTDVYTVKIDTTPQSEITDVVWPSDDLSILAELTKTAASNDSGAYNVGFYKGTDFTAEEVQGVIEEITGTRSAHNITIASLETALGVVETWKGNITSSIAELNTLDGFTGDKDDLNVLTGTTLTNAELSALHNHADIFDIATFLLGRAVSGKGIKEVYGFRDSAFATPLIIHGCLDDNAHENQGIRLDVSEAGGTAGILTVKNNLSEYAVISAHELGDLDLSTANFLSAVDLADDGAVTNMLRILDSRLFTLYREMQALGLAYDAAVPNIYLQAGGALVADVTPYVTWTRTLGNYKRFGSWTCDITADNVTQINVKIFCGFGAGTAAAIGYVKLSILEFGGIAAESVVAEFVGATLGASDWITISLNVTGNYTFPQQVSLELKSDGTYEALVNSNFEVSYGH